MNWTKGLQTVVANRAELSKPMLSLVLSGHRRPSAAVAARISAATSGEVSIEELLYPDGVPLGAVLCRACHCSRPVRTDK